jgi:hypothetical protein
MAYPSICVVSLAILCMVSCSAPRHDTPVKLIEASADGITTLFERECIAQADFDWIRAESKRMRDACGYFDNGDCAQRVDGSVTWQVPTSGAASVEVTMFGWMATGNGPRDRRLDCEISMPESFGPYIPQVIDNIRRSGIHVSSPVERDSIAPPPALVGPWPRVDVYHWVSVERFKELTLSRLTAKGELAHLAPDDPLLLTYTKTASRPWRIVYLARRNDR